MTVANDSTATSPEDGILKRSFSQNVYRQPNEMSTASWLSNSSNTNTNSSSNISHPQSNTSNSWGMSFNSSSNTSDMTTNSQPSEDRYAALSSLFAEVNSTNSLGNNTINQAFMPNTISCIKQDNAFTSSGTANNLFQQQFSSSVNSNNNNLAKSMSSSSVMGPPPPPSLSSIARPPSKRNSIVNHGNGPLTSFVGANNSVVNGVNSNAWNPSNNANNNMTRCKSYGSLSSNSEMRMTPVSIGSSRGPSPLTIGFNDTVPLAVAIQESISAKFKGTDESRCDVQMLGSLKVAFPAGIVQALMNNPSPSSLMFKIKNSCRIEKFYPNKGILNMP